MKVVFVEIRETLELITNINKKGETLNINKSLLTTHC